MRKRGTYHEVEFIYKGFTMMALAYEYELRKYNANKTVYVINMKDLKNEISNFNKEY